MSETMRITIVDPTKQILREIAEPKLGRRDVAQTLALAFKYGQAEEIDWRAVGEAAIARWSTSGWLWIKTQAHSGKCFREPKL